MAERPNVMISSTIVDLPEHREEVKEACLRQGMFPLMMEEQPASYDDPIQFSLKLVNQADIYVGVYAHRYGYVPPGRDISLTEMEYIRAVERGIPRLIFIMDKSHPITIADVEQGEGAAKLKAFKDHVGANNFVNFFKSPDDLRADVINSLSKHRVPDVTAFHYVSDIPAPPEAYIAHPYTLLQSKGLIGRQAELNLLTDWVAKPAADVYRARILSFVAIGGMGKSALTWKWFNDIAPQELKPNGREWGRMWWSFYESDASFENFVTRALAYVSRRPREEVEKIPAPDSEAQLLAALDREPFLVVLDGVERILIAYARMDAALMSDDAVKPERALRKTADPRAGRFLQKLAHVHSSRILVSARLFPAELENVSGDPIPGAFRHDLRGLEENDALDLCRTLGVTGSRDTLLPVFRSFANHPLLIQALAGEISSFRKVPGDFDAWRMANPGFDPSSLVDVHGAMAHVLYYALQGLAGPASRVLQMVAAFRMPANYDTLVALLVGDDKPFCDEKALDVALGELEDRGLLGWDRRANRYDLHPIVRGVVWSGLDEGAKRSTYRNLEAHFKSLPPVNQRKVGCLEDLTPAIELYSTLIGLGRYDAALDFFMRNLFDLMQFRLSSTREQAELLEMLFPEGTNQPPRLTGPFHEYALRALAETYHRGGRPGEAMQLYGRCLILTKDQRNVISHNQMLADTFYLQGEPCNAEIAGLKALLAARKASDQWMEAVTLSRLGLLLAARNSDRASETALQRSLTMFAKTNAAYREGGTKTLMAQRKLWLANPNAARVLADTAWHLAHEKSFERDFVRASRLQGQAALGLNDLATADERLHHALARARGVNLVEEELPALTALAELRRRQGDLRAARELLDDVWEPSERGPYPLFHADALNVLAQTERDAGNREAAIAAASKAYRLAWCDGPPYAYHWGLEAAKRHLAALGALEPADLAPFDESRFEPMPQIEIDPPEKEDEGDQI